MFRSLSILLPLPTALSHVRPVLSVGLLLTTLPEPFVPGSARIQTSDSRIWPDSSTGSTMTVRSCHCGEMRATDHVTMYERRMQRRRNIVDKPKRLRHMLEGFRQAGECDHRSSREDVRVSSRLLEPIVDKAEILTKLFPWMIAL
jgi:hypothetical protein